MEIDVVLYQTPTCGWRSCKEDFFKQLSILRKEESCSW